MVVPPGEKNEKTIAFKRPGRDLRQKNSLLRVRENI